MQDVTLSNVMQFIILIVALFIIFSMLVNSNIFMSGEEYKFTKLWQRGILKITGDEAKMKIECAQGRYKVILYDLGFLYTEGKEEIEFVSILDFEKQLVLGKKPDKSEVFNSGERSDMIFEFSSEEIKGNRILPISFWRNKQPIIDYMSSPKSYYDLISDEDRYPYYLSSVSITGNFDKVKCK